MTAFLNAWLSICAYIKLLMDDTLSKRVNLLYSLVLITCEFLQTIMRADNYSVMLSRLDYYMICVSHFGGTEERVAVYH